MMEKFYGSINYNLLHLTRINRKVTLCTGVNIYGRTMANWHIYVLIELVQNIYHKIYFRNDNLEGWMHHLPPLQFNIKAVRLAKTEYHRFWSKTSRGDNFGAGN